MNETRKLTYPQLIDSIPNLKQAKSFQRTMSPWCTIGHRQGMCNQSAEAELREGNDFPFKGQPG